MLWSICSSKGGSGASVIAAALAIESRVSDVLLVDLGGDLSDILGVEPPELGLRDWIRSEAGVESIDNLIQTVRPGLRLLATGGPIDGTDVGRMSTLLPHLAANPMVIFDVGVANTEPFSAQSVVLAASDRTTMVLRACYLSLRRAQQLDLSADDVIEVVEGGRALTTVDVEGVLGRAVSARIAVDPQIARAVDAGLLLSRRPRGLRRCARSLLSTEVAG